MTVCIAAISTWYDRTTNPGTEIQRPLIVLASDRMITARRIREYELADQTKLIWYRNNVAVLMAGSIDVLLEAYGDAVTEIGLAASVAEFTSCFANHIQRYRRRNVERLYFEKYGLTIESFVSRQKEWTPDFWERLDNAIGDDDLDLGEAIVAGFDGEQASIFTIEGAGWERPWTASGFCAIGIGAEHAEAEFAHALYTHRRDWIEAIRITFFAKKRAEEAPGVGRNTDLWYLLPSGPAYFWQDSETVQTLDSLFDASRYAELNAIKTDQLIVGKAMVNEYGASNPRAATEEERRQAEAKAEEADRREAEAVNEENVRGSLAEGESKN